MVWRREAVVKLVARSPEGVWSSLLSVVPDERLLGDGNIYLLRYRGVLQAAEWHSHLAPVGIRALLVNIGELHLRRVDDWESYGLERDVRVPSFLPTLPFFTRNQERSFVVFLGLARTNDADLVISSAAVSARIEDGMNV